MAGYASNDGTWTNTFDDAGNEIRKSQGAGAETWNYLYDNPNELIAAEQHASDGGTLLAKVQYKYDALGDRIERDEDADGNGTYETVERFAYDGWKVHQDAGGGQAGFIGQENFDVWADLNGSNVLTTRRLFGDAIDQIVARINSGGTAAWYYQDRLGSVRNLVDATGTLQETLTYVGFGNILTDSSPTFGDRYKYTAREWDSLTKLQGNRARWYDPATGKWMTQDPIGFNAQDSNLYRYVANDPLARFDPDGFLAYRLALESTLSKKPVITKTQGSFMWPIRWIVTSNTDNDNGNKINGIIMQRIVMNGIVEKEVTNGNTTRWQKVPIAVFQKKANQYWEFWEVKEADVKPYNDLSKDPDYSKLLTTKDPVYFNDLYGMQLKHIYGSEPKAQTRGEIVFSGKAVFYQGVTIGDVKRQGYQLSKDFPTGAGGLEAIAACKPPLAAGDYYTRDDLFFVIESKLIGKPYRFLRGGRVVVDTRKRSNYLTHMIRVEWGGFLPEGGSQKYDPATIVRERSPMT